MPVAYILVGVPASGKSTWAETRQSLIDCDYISSDIFIEECAREKGVSYSEAFDEAIKPAISKMLDELEKSVLACRDIIWDQTSTTIASRAKKLNLLRSYHKVAVVFKTPDEEEHRRRLSLREGKTIPEEVLKEMIENFEQPTIEEGFDEILYV